MNVSIPELSKLEKDFVIEKHTTGWRHKKIANALAKKGYRNARGRAITPNAVSAMLLRNGIRSAPGKVYQAKTTVAIEAVFSPDHTIKEVIHSNLAENTKIKVISALVGPSMN